MQVVLEKIVSVIESCDFLSQDLILRWIGKLNSIPEEFHDLIYKTFLDAKKRMDDFYIQVELARDEGNKYRSLLVTKVTEIVKLVNKQKLGKIDEKIDL